MWQDENGNWIAGAVNENDYYNDEENYDDYYNNSYNTSIKNTARGFTKKGKKLSKGAPQR